MEHNNKYKRPEVLHGATVKIVLPMHGKVWLTANQDKGRVVEIFIRADNEDLHEYSFMLSQQVSKLLQLGQTVTEVMEDLNDLHATKTKHIKKGGKQFASLAQRICYEVMEMQKHFTQQEEQKNV